MSVLPRPGMALTTHESLILGLIANGLSNKQIATELVISPCTAKTHVQRICAKLAARNRAHAIRRGIEEGWLSIRSSGG